MRLMVTRPEHDVTTKYLSSWAGEIIAFAERKGIEVIDLFRAKANLADFEGRVRKLQPEAVFLNGHGEDNLVRGHDNEVLVKAGDNHQILKGRVTYALSCNSGAVLGRTVAAERATAYIGYSDEFIFVADRNYISRPLTDPKAQPFLESSNQVMISLIKGNRAFEASERSKNKFKEYFTKMASSIADPDSLQAAQCLRWNMLHQVCLGDGNAKL